MLHRSVANDNELKHLIPQLLDSYIPYKMGMVVVAQ